MSEKTESQKIINFEEYMKDLSPELREKAKACESLEELLKLAGENKIPLPDEALEAVAGGKGGNNGTCDHVRFRIAVREAENCKSVALVEYVCSKCQCHIIYVSNDGYMYPLDNRSWFTTICSQYIYERIFNLRVEGGNLAYCEAQS